MKSLGLTKNNGRDTKWIFVKDERQQNSKDSNYFAIICKKKKTKETMKWRNWKNIVTEETDWSRTYRKKSTIEIGGRYLTPKSRFGRAGTVPIATNSHQSDCTVVVGRRSSLPLFLGSKQIERYFLPFLVWISKKSHLHHYNSFVSPRCWSSPHVDNSRSICL